MTKRCPVGSRRVGNRCEFPEDRHIPAFKVLRKICLMTNRNGKRAWKASNDEHSYCLLPNDVYLYADTETGDGLPPEHYYYRRGMPSTQWGFTTKSLLRLGHGNVQAIRIMGAMRMNKIHGDVN